MIRILALSDVHCDWGRFPVDQMPDADLCVVAGDLTDWGARRNLHELERSKDFLHRLMQRYRFVFWIPGNHEVDVSPTFYNAHAGKGLSGVIHSLYYCPTYLLESMLRRQSPEIEADGEKGLSLIGVSCSPCYDAPQLAETWDYMTADPAQEKAAYEAIEYANIRDVIVSHCPPYGVLDSAGYVLGRGEAHVGSRELLGLIDRQQPRLVICGHVHEQGGKEMQFGPTLVVNVARTFRLIEITEQEIIVK